MESIQQTWDGISDASSEDTTGRCTATISRNGDLVYRMYFEVNGQNDMDVDNPGATFIDNVELEIGGQKIDKHSGLWMECWAELTEPNPTGAIMTGPLTGGTSFQKMSAMGGVNSTTDGHDGKFWIPLQFWFCRNPGLALPLIALQYHEVKVILNHFIGPVWAEDGFTATNKLWCDYIYLDTDERRRFAQVSHEYLIEQVQEQSLTVGAGSNNLNFNHPVKELIWTTKKSLVGNGTKGSGTVSTAVGTGNFQLKLNGHDRFAARDFRYFTRVQVWQHHSGSGGLDTQGIIDGAFNDSIAVYSFALKPEEHQPSGTCNFSRIDNAQLVSTSGQNADIIFAVNYNVLRIMSGMGGLAYSN